MFLNSKVIDFFTGFYDDNTNNTFGVVKKGVYRPLSDFNFEYIMKVKANSTSTGYIIKVTPESFNEQETQSRYLHLCIHTCS